MFAPWRGQAFVATPPNPSCTASTSVGRRDPGKPRHVGVAHGRGSVRSRWRLEDARRQPRQQRDEDVGRRLGTSTGHRTGRCLRQPAGLLGRVQIRFAGTGFSRCAALPGTPESRHARTAQADPGAGRAAGPRPQGGADYRRAHVGCVRKRCRPQSISPQRPPQAAAGASGGRRPHHPDANTGTLNVHVPDDEFAARPATGRAPSDTEWVGTGRELFASMRSAVGPADQGATVFGSIS